MSNPENVTPSLPLDAATSSYVDSLRVFNETAQKNADSYALAVRGYVAALAGKGKEFYASINNHASTQPSNSAPKGFWGRFFGAQNSSAQIAQGELLENAFGLMTNPIATIANPSIYKRFWQTVRGLRGGVNGSTFWGRLTPLIPYLMVATALTLYFAWWRPKEQAKKRTPPEPVAATGSGAALLDDLFKNVARQADAAKGLGMDPAIVQRAANVTLLHDGTEIITSAESRPTPQAARAGIAWGATPPHVYASLNSLKADRYLSSLADHDAPANGAALHGFSVDHERHSVVTQDLPGRYGGRPPGRLE